MVTNHLASLSDSPVEIVHSIIRQRIAKFLDVDQLQKEAHFIFQHQGVNTFRQYFVNTAKYPYTPKQLRTIFQKMCCSTFEHVQEDISSMLSVSLTKALNEKEFAGERTGNTVIQQQIIWRW
ncbi:12732_t:CDS:2 [Gigaspora margarita]|uniref:12732_t:CDS:1 n=1 Tax=Gigaspora margarita TaxID=4874 RepID=A0ABN7UB23_GIGMA|nr:12732_t:CDS:2 [Gigaspora margarita]